MKQIYLKSKLYLLPVLMLCATIQSINSYETSQKTSDTHEIAITRGGRRQDQYQKQNMLGAGYLLESQNTPGSLDPSFGADGTGYVINSMGYNAAPRSVVVQEDNKIVVGGIRDGYPLLARYNEDGSLDSSFGVGIYGPGVTIQTDLGRYSYFNSIAIQQDKKIVAVGSTGGTAPTPGATVAGKSILARYKSDGKLDTDFGVNGIIKTNIKGELNSVIIQPDGKILVVGYKDDSYTIKYFSAYDYTIGYINLDKFFVGQYKILLMRYNENGSLDNTFGTQGIVEQPIIVKKFNQDTSWVRGVKAVLKYGAITVFGTFNPQDGKKQLARAAFNMNGSPRNVFTIWNPIKYANPPFWETNTITRETGYGDYVPYDALAADNGIFIVGSSILHDDKKTFTTSLFSYDYNDADSYDYGNPNRNWRDLTITPTSNQNDNAYPRSLVLDKNEKPIVIGYTITTDNNNYFSLVRYNTDATLDTTFGQQGVQNSLLTQNNLPNKVNIPAIGAIQPNKEKIVVVGMYSNKVSPTASLMTVARYII